ncbi:MAG: CHAT domain-containing protein, partial [Paludibacteraceae bacterium]
VFQLFQRPTYPLLRDRSEVAYQNYSEALDIITYRATRSSKIEADIVSEWANLVDILLEDSTSVWAYQFVYNTYNTLYGEKSVYTIRSINDLGVHYADRQQYDLSLPYVRKAYEIQRDYYGINTLNTIINESNFWECMAAIPSLRDSAYYYLLDTDRNIRHYLQDMFGVMTEQQREDFWNDKLSVSYAMKMPSFLIDYAQHYNSKAFGDIYDAVLLQRGLLLNSNETMNRIIAQSEDTLLQNQWSNLLFLKSELSSSSALFKDNRQQLEQRKEQLEQSIMQSSIDFRLEQENFSIHWQDIQEQLNSNEVAIEFMVNAVNHWGLMHASTDSVMYYALVLRKGYEYPIFIPLFERDELEHFNMWSTQQMYDYNIRADSAYNLIWRKIEPYLHRGETIYFAPTHALAQIALEALPVTQDSVIGDFYNMVRLSSTREILHINETKETYDAVLYGGIAYDLSADEMMEESLKYDIPSNKISRSVEWDTINRGIVKYLPGTKREVEKINTYLTEQNKATYVFTGAAANEESFTTLSGKHTGIIHLATHGFYWNQKQAENKDVFKTKQIGADDPLLRCGLLFAGANIAFSGRADLLKDGVQDGILTAREIASMDLSNCQLVVLSACETGRGDYSNDGTIGLQRAFKLAGVQTIIMSLWPVNDATTQFLMTEFYKNWITNGQSKREAFRNAQNRVRSEFKEPVYWAGFIMLD